MKLFTRASNHVLRDTVRSLSPEQIVRDWTPSEAAAQAFELEMELDEVRGVVTGYNDFEVTPRVRLGCVFNWLFMAGVSAGFGSLIVIAVVGYINGDVDFGYEMVALVGMGLGGLWIFATGLPFLRTRWREYVASARKEHPKRTTFAILSERIEVDGDRYEWDDLAEVRLESEVPRALVIRRRDGQNVRVDAGENDIVVLAWLQGLMEHRRASWGTAALVPEALDAVRDGTFPAQDAP